MIQQGLVMISTPPGGLLNEIVYMEPVPENLGQYEFHLRFDEHIFQSWLRILTSRNN